MPLNFEFKARTDNLHLLEQKLLELNPLYKGEDHQTDTYFNVPSGRMKLREGNIEQALIYYQRANEAEARTSRVLLYQAPVDARLKEILTSALGIKTIVHKRRRIYFIDNVKFHFDCVDSLGNFIEVEAIDSNGSIGINRLKSQCSTYAELFSIKPGDYVAESYSELISG